MHLIELSAALFAVIAVYQLALSTLPQQTCTCTKTKDTKSDTTIHQESQNALVSSVVELNAAIDIMLKSLGGVHANIALVHGCS